MTRRELFGFAGAGLLSAASVKAFDLQNLSYPLRMIDGAITPSNLLFVRDHFSEPEVSLGNWTLRVDGRVERPYELGFADLVEMPGKKIEAVLECAGNAANGSAVSNGVWEGVPISLLLESARPAQDSAFVLLEGADSGRLFETGEALPYTQIVPFANCKDTSNLVAFKYNDLALPKHNGFPARAIFPGCYGMNSVKWLRRITVLGAADQNTIFERSGMNRLYNRVTDRNGNEQIKRVLSLQVKSAISWPLEGTKLATGRYIVWGFAWSGTGAIRQLSISLDDGKHWEAAKLPPRSQVHSWVRWTCDWNAKPGDYAIMSRAMDTAGNEQPLARDPKRKDSYELNWCLPVHCSVR